MSLKSALCGFLVFLFSCVAVGSSLADDSLLSPYDYYLNSGVQAFKDHDDAAALDYFNKAHEIRPANEEPLQYINLLKRAQDGLLRPVNKVSQPDVAVGIDGRAKVIVDTLDKLAVKPAVVKTEVVASKVAAITPAVSRPAAAIPLPAKTAPVPVVKLSRSKVDTISLDDIQNSGQAKPTINVEIGSTVIITGKIIRKFLEIDPGFISVKEDGQDQIRIEALKRGSTYLHIWDERGRTTLLVEVIFPRIPDDQVVQRPVDSDHAVPFRIKYLLSNSSYYYGPDVAGLRRTNIDIQETFGIEGDTPYGLFDTSLAATGFGDVSQISYYTVGLSNIPLKATSDLDIRFFDAYRMLSPLTMPGTRLQGAFADVKFMDNTFGISASHGSQLTSFNYLAQGFQNTRDVFVDAVQVSLLPGNETHHFTLNYAEGYGSDREESLTKKVYSMEGRQQVAGLDINGELARSDNSAAAQAGIKFATGLLKQGLYFRNIGKDFTTIVTAPSNQGEIGAIWTTNMDNERVATDTLVDIYQDRILPNPDDPEALNYDSSAHMRLPFGDRYALDATVRHVNTPGEAFPRWFASGDVRLTRSFDFLGGRRGSIYVGAVDQMSRFEFSPESEYDRSALSSGIYVPLTRALSGFINYEYSWLREKLTHDSSNPAVMNAGLNYNKQITQKLSGNVGLTYRDEQDVSGANSFLAGEDSVALSAGLNYSPKNDVSLYCDTRVRNVLAQRTDSPSYYDMDVRFGMNMAFGLGVSWDPLGTVSGFVYKDRDGNKGFEPNDKGFLGDEGLAGVRVKIGSKEAVTDQRGWYSMMVRAKRASVTPVLESLPPGFVFVTPPSERVEIVQGRTRRVDFGLTTQSGIYGTAYIDNNGDGVPDQDDRFVSRVKVVLDGKMSQVTDSRGAYFFNNISQGNHTLAIDMKTMPAEFIPLVKLKNEVDVAEGTTYIFHIPLRIKTE